MLQFRVQNIPTGSSDRTILTLEFVDKTNKEKTAKKTSEGSKIRNKTIENMVKIENYLKENGESKTNAIAEYLNLSSARTRKILSEMKTIEATGTNTNRKYRLKDNQK